MIEAIKAYMIGCVAAAICMTPNDQPAYEKLAVSFFWPASIYLILTELGNEKLFRP